MITAIEQQRTGRTEAIPVTRNSLPIVSHALPIVSGAEKERLAEFAARLCADEPALGGSFDFGALVRPGLAADRPALFLEDHHSLGLYTALRDPHTEYRSLLLAGNGDFVTIAGDRVEEFEAYCRDVLCLGQTEIIVPPPHSAMERVTAMVLRDAVAMNRMVECARRHGGFSVIPYIGTADVWVLAREIAARSGQPVHVAAPPPRLTQRANDKLWFADRVAEILDRRALPPTWYAYGPAPLAQEMALLARRYDRLVVKVPDSAGSQGNIVLASEDVLARSHQQLRDWLIRILGSLSWDGEFPLLVGVWDSPTVASPSVQIWIPLPEEGLPIIEGVFQQTVEGRQGMFVGAAPAELPQCWLDRLAEEGIRIALLLQAIGYYGRCSFDAVIAGTTLTTAALHWIECNGRWGGVSTPMTLANRLVGDWQNRPFQIVQRRLSRIRPLSVSAAIELFGGLLFRPGVTDEGIVLLTPQRLVAGTGIHIMAMAATTARAQGLAAQALARLGDEAASP
ncbi:MAG: hypothetical protein JSU82_13580 [Rhodospirillales bacterium]|nr:MAG: hypothetical protein JSU82_13580 [Rhodospirillales bacterium]